MALSAPTTWEVRSTGASTNGGGFNVGNANFATDLAATSATGNSPVVTSASYNFVSGDVGAWLFVPRGTSWLPGWYQIASVAAGAATLNASIGAVQLYGGVTILNTAAGCATTASPTGGTWSIDYSQQASAQIAWADLVIGATTTNFTSAAHPITKAMTGNLFQQVGGTGFNTGWFEVVSTSGTTGTADRSLGTTASTGGQANLGGCLANPSNLVGAIVESNHAFVTGSYTNSATITLAPGGSFPTDTIPYTVISGYSTYRGDGGHATITLATNGSLTAISCTSQGMIVENFTINCASLSSSIGIGLSANSMGVRNCKISNFTSAGIVLSGQGVFARTTEITGGGSGATAGFRITGGGINVVSDNNIHDNSCTGISSTANTIIENNLITNNTGASSDGIASARSNIIKRNTIHGSGRHGINNTSGNIDTMLISGNILSSNSGYGLVGASGAGLPAMPEFDGNAYYNNTSGTRSNANDVGATNPIDGVAPYVNALDIILTANPFVAASSNNYMLNTTAGGGAACRGMGVPQSWPGNSLTTSSPDMGAAQSAPAAGGGANLSRVFSGF
jgi:Right handed beta helix region